MHFYPYHDIITQSGNNIPCKTAPPRKPSILVQSFKFTSYSSFMRTKHRDVLRIVLSQLITIYNFQFLKSALFICLVKHFRVHCSACTCIPPSISNLHILLYISVNFISIWQKFHIFAIFIKINAFYRPKNTYISFCFLNIYIINNKQ